MASVFELSHLNQTLLLLLTIGGCGVTSGGIATGEAVADSLAGYVHILYRNHVQTYVTCTEHESRIIERLD